MISSPGMLLSSPRTLAVFSLESVQLKVWALHIQWGGRFVRRFSAWMQFLFIILVWCMARRQVKSCLTRDALILVPCLPFIRRSCLPGWPWMGVSLLLLILWSWLPLLFVLLSCQSRPSRRILSFWSSTVISQLVLEALAGCSATILALHLVSVVLVWS